MPVWTWVPLGLAAAFAVWRIGHAWWKYRGNRVIICPENHTPAGVRVDSRHAAANSLLHAADLRLSDCSRWPEKAGCGQPCLAQIHAAPEDCLVQNIAARWFEGKKCVSCGRPFGEISWVGSPPALLSADKKSVEWREVPAEKIYDILADSEPICFACHTANRMIHEHPELVIDRHRIP